MSKIFARLAYGYIALPILIFFIGWCNPLVAILGSIILLTSFYFACKNAPELWYPTSKKQWLFLFSLAVIALVWVYSSGIGALVFQSSDHNCRNPIFELLVSKPWPVISSYRANVFSHTETPIMLAYYIGFWMVPAMVGKLFNSIAIGYYAQIAWATLGVFLVFYYILSFLKHKNYFPILIFIFFSGLDIVGAIFFHRFYLFSPVTHLEWWNNGSYDIAGFTTQLFWVFNQALPAWLVTLMLLKEKNNKNILFLYSCLPLYSTFPFIGLFPIVVYLILKNVNSISRKYFSFEYIKNVFKSVLTFQNTIGMLVIMIVSYLYLSQNIAGGQIRIANNVLIELILYFTICFSVEVGIYLLLIWKYNKTNPLFYIITACLLFLPSIKVGFAVDFGSRTIIPSLVILCLLVIKTFDDDLIKKSKCTAVMLIIVLLIGANTPMHEFFRAVYYTAKGITKVEARLSTANFFAYVEGNRFLKYVGKTYKPHSLMGVGK